MEITMMWKLAGAALAAAAIATAPIAGADNTPDPNIGRQCTHGLCHALQNVQNPTARSAIERAIERKHPAF
jgi:hypothetical protein